MLLVCAAMANAIPGQLQAQGQSDLFVDPPPLKQVSTLGKLLRQTGAPQTDEGLESIVGEPTRPTQSQNEVFEPLESIPGDADYGPVGGFSESGTPQGRPAEGGMQERTDLSLPNSYRGDVFFPDGTFNGNQQGSSTRRETQSVIRKPASLGEPSIGRSKLIDIESSSGKISGREIVRERYEDGSVRIVRSVAQDEDGNYFNDGGYILYDRSQTPIAAGSFSQGKLEGEWERIYQTGSGGLFRQPPYNLFSGPYKSTATFRQGKLDGTWQLADREGRLMTSINYVDGIRKGPAVWYFPSGQKMQQAKFSNGLPDGFVQRWDRQGKLQSRQEFVDGRRVIREKSKHANQTVASEKTFLGKRIKVQGRDNWWAAKPAVFEESGDKVQHGLVREWYPNRQPKLSGQFVKGQRVGLFTWWHQNGNKKAEGKFEQGQRVGVWRYWHESGMKRSDGSFVDDQPAGVWRVWNESGKLVSEKDVEQPEPTEETSQDNGGETVIDTEQWEFGKDSSSVIEPPAEDLKLPMADEKSEQDDDGTDEFTIELETIEAEPVERDPGSLIGG